MNTTVIQPAEERTTTIGPVKFENLANRVNSLMQSIARRAYEIFEGSGRSSGHDLDNWFKAESELLLPTSVKLTDAGDRIELRAEVSGFNELDIKVSVESQKVTITGSREIHHEEKKEGANCATSSSEEILRIVELPVEVDSEEATASLKNGVLEVSVPKIAKAKLAEVKRKAA
jgi:HSP20 family protein